MEILIWFIFVLVAVYAKAAKQGQKENDASTLRDMGLTNVTPPKREEPPAQPTPIPWEEDDTDDDWGRRESHYFSADEGGEGHVASVGLSREKQLEQLETWKEAGLIDEDEYKERKRKIKRG